MAYCGILDGLCEIDGKPVDLSRLEEGVIVAGDEEFDADEWITNEDKLDLFNEMALRTKADLLKEIDSLLGRIDKESGEESKHSPAFYDRYRDLVLRFKKEVEKSTFPEKLEDWWEYNYDIRGTGVTLQLTHTSSFDVDADDSVSAIADTTFQLMNIRTQLLTVEQYAQSYGVTVTTVRQWIRRGKIRSAIKMGSEWRIPELAEVMERGYTDGHYARKEYLTDIPAEYAFFNDYDYVDISQNRKDKGMFDLCLSKKFDIRDYDDEEKAFAENIRNIQMDREEREKFELYLIASPFVENPDSYIEFR